MVIDVKHLGMNIAGVPAQKLRHKIVLEQAIGNPFVVHSLALAQQINKPCSLEPAPQLQQYGTPTYLQAFISMRWPLCMPGVQILVSIEWEARIEHRGSM